MKKALHLLFLAMFAFAGIGQTTTINVSTPGELETLVGTQKYEITNLSVSGSLNGDDIVVLRDMAGITKTGSPSNGKMRVLDMAGASIVAGGVAYIYDYNTYEQFYTKENTLNDYTFYNCSALESVTLPRTLTAIGNMVFSVCANLKEINVPADNASFKSIDGVLFSNADHKLIRYPNAHAGQVYNVPADVKVIGYEAFADCVDLLSIVLPEGLVSIEGVAFTFCKKMEAIDIPASVSTIAPSAFNYCNSLKFINVAQGNANLTSVNGVLFNKDKSRLLRYPMGKKGDYHVPETVKEIGEYAFDMGTGLTAVTLPEGLVELKKYAFYNCTQLKSIVIPNSVNSMGNGVFSACKGLESVQLSNAIASLGDWAFSGCKALTEIELPQTLTSFGEGAFSDCVLLKSVAVPEGTGRISNSMFAGCKGLEKAILPASVTSIGDYAFYGCQGLVQLYTYPVVPPTCGVFPFYGVKTDQCTLFVPAGKLNDYKNHAVFSQFKLMTEMEPTGVSSVLNNEAVPVATYTLDGRIATADYRGIVIEKMSDGTSHKVLVK